MEITLYRIFQFLFVIAKLFLSPRRIDETLPRNFSRAFARARLRQYSVVDSSSHGERVRCTVSRERAEEPVRS